MPAPERVLGASPVRREMTTDATAIATIRTSSAMSDGFSSAGAIGTNCTPTTSQIHGAMYSERPHRAISGFSRHRAAELTPPMA